MHLICSLSSWQCLLDREGEGARQLSVVVHDADIEPRDQHQDARPSMAANRLDLMQAADMAKRHNAGRVDPVPADLGCPGIGRLFGRAGTQGLEGHHARVAPPRLTPSPGCCRAVKKESSLHRIDKAAPTRTGSLPTHRMLVGSCLVGSQEIPRERGGERG